MTKSKQQKSLSRWTKQNWRTSSGKPSTQGKKATGGRYLPDSEWKKLSASEKKATNAKKKADTKKGKQFSKQPKSIAKKTSAKRRKT